MGERRARPAYWAITVLTILVAALAAPSARANAGDSVFTPACPAYGDQQICSGEVPSFDGTALDVDLVRPAQNTGSRHPLIVMLHGFGNSKHEWESTTDAGDGADKYHWNSHWFSEHGYYVLTYTARGFKTGDRDRQDQPPTPSGTSAGLPRGQIHLKSRATEIRDTQWLAALAANAYPDINPSQVAVSGGSYGGGESWMQASQATWTFPYDCSRDASKCDLPDLPDATLSRPDVAPLPKLDLQVAVPKYPWTDLAYSLAPNGHPGAGAGPNQPPPAAPAGYCDVDQSLSNDPCYASSQGDPENDAGDGNPFGVVKLSYTNVFFAYGNGASNGGGFQKEDPCDNPPAPASVEDWYTHAVVTGEPYDAEGVEPEPGPQVRRALTECRGSYYQDEGWKAQAAGPRRVAVFSIQGWTDDLFTPVESFRQFKYLKGLNPRWPVEVALADVGHPRAKNNPDTWHALNNQAWQWLQSNINGSTDQQTTVSSQQTVCDNASSPSENPNDPNQNITASTPEDLSHGKISVQYAGPGNTDSARGDPNSAVDDPVVRAVVGQIKPGSGNCPASAGPSQYTGVSKPLQSDRIYVGLGSVTVPYQLTGTTAQLDARLWDVPPGSAANQAGSADCQQTPTPQGCPLLIARGTYRLDVAAYDQPSGVIRIPLFGDHYKFAKGHELRIDLTQDDNPYLRKSNVPSSIAVTNPTLNLPTRDSAVTTLGGVGSSGP